MFTCVRVFVLLATTLFATVLQKRFAEGCLSMTFVNATDVRSRVSSHHQNSICYNGKYSDNTWIGDIISAEPATLGHLEFFVNRNIMVIKSYKRPHYNPDEHWAKVTPFKDMVWLKLGHALVLTPIIYVGNNYPYIPWRQWLFN